MTREIKFRQPLIDMKSKDFKGFHYWGYDGTTFIAPMTGPNYANTGNLSDEFTGLHDKNGAEIYDNHYIENTLTGMRYRVMYVDGRYKGQFVAHGNICGGYSIDSLHKVDLNFFGLVGNVHEGMEA